MSEITQLIDQGVIKCFKRKDCRKLLPEIPDNIVYIHKVLEKGLARSRRYRTDEQKRTPENRRTCFTNDKFGNEILNDNDIVEAVTTQEKELEEEDEVSKERNDTGILSNKEGMAALMYAMIYIKQQAIASAVDIMFMKKWRDYAFEKQWTRRSRGT
ncbi:hypothetical protein J6590_077985 [Homalodisca vitripennis]|nr:hypothetical protein J6590_077985 [Homalodisca vitripennis]